MLGQIKAFTSRATAQAAPAWVDLGSTPANRAAVECRPAAPTLVAGSLGMGCDGRIQDPLPPGVVSLPAWRLRHGNVPFDLRRSPRCGARTRAGGACRQPAMANGRCRLHGGKSTGARTAAGRGRCRRARLRHGLRSAAFREMRMEGMRIRRNIRALCALVKDEMARRENRPPPAEYLRLLAARRMSREEIVAEIHANHAAAVRQGEATLRRRAMEREARRNALDRGAYLGDHPRNAERMAA